MWKHIVKTHSPIFFKTLFIRMKTKLTQRKFKADKLRSCAMCKPYKQGREGKRKPSEVRDSIGHAQQLAEV